MRLLVLTIILTTFVQATIPAEVPDAKGEELYREFCSKCHGSNLEGGNAPSLVDGIWMYGLDKIRNITFGIAQQGMPAFGDALSKDQIEAISRFIDESAHSLGAARPPIPDTLYTYDYDILVQKWVEGLEIPWAIAFVDSTTTLITERTGRLRIVQYGVLSPKAVENTPAVIAQSQGGLMDVAIDPDHGQNGWVYLAYSHALVDTSQTRPPAMTRIARGRIREGKWHDHEVIYDAPNDTYQSTRHHYGSRIVFDSSGNLYFSVGDRGRSGEAQDLSKPNGKIHRILPDGNIPTDNPFTADVEALTTIFSYGHRNPQGLAVHPVTGEVWSAEHGPMGGDEINIVRRGDNYGWPKITYGRNYNGTLVSQHERLPGMVQPVLFWRPSIAVCAVEFYQGRSFGKWENRLLVSALAYEEVRLLAIENNRVIHQEVILKNAGRVRDVTNGPDGAIYVVLNSPGTVLRLTPIVEDDGF